MNLAPWNQAHGIPDPYVTHSRDEVCDAGERVLVLTAADHPQGLPCSARRARQEPLPNWLALKMSLTRSSNHSMKIAAPLSAES